MTFVSCSIPEQFVNPLFEVFDGGDFILSSYRDIEEDFTRMRIYFEDPAQTKDAKRCLASAMEIVGVDAAIEVGEIPDEDWKLAYRRHFKVEEIGKRLLIVPEWELDKILSANGRDPSRGRQPDAAEGRARPSRPCCIEDGCDIIMNNKR